jgi:threonine dehydratase
VIDHVTLIDVFQARRRIEPYVRRTPLVASSWLSEAASAQVSLKLECVQVSSSFKARGAFNAVLARLERGRQAPRRFVTASAGNHGRALALAADTFGVPLTVFTPVDAPRAKIAAIERHGAELRAEGRDYDDAERLALAWARETGAEFISPYNDPDVIAAAATIALEIVEEAPGTTVVVVPIGGGGLIGGIGSAMKAIDEAHEVVGVELEVSCPFLTSLPAGHLVPIVPGPSLADGLTGNPAPDSITFELVRQFVDRIVTVSERDLAAAIAGLVEREHVVSEGAGAAATAALVGRRVDLRGQRVVAIVSGGNIDRPRLAALLRDGSVSEG